MNEPDVFSKQGQKIRQLTPKIESAVTLMEVRPMGQEEIPQHIVVRPWAYPVCGSI